VPAAVSLLSCLTESGPSPSEVGLERRWPTRLSETAVVLSLRRLIESGPPARDVSPQLAPEFGLSHIVECKRMRLEDGMPTTAIFGRAAHTPFGTVSQNDKLRIGRRVKEFVNA
jgi:hypothetical protein